MVDATLGPTSSLSLLSSRDRQQAYCKLAISQVVLGLGKEVTSVRA
jgi:hypothetical protein